MKTFREYLIESKKIYNFKVKIAGEIPKEFESELKQRLEKYKVITFEKLATTPVQKLPIDFPNIANTEVTVYSVIVEYPVTAIEISTHLKEMEISEEYYRVRGSSEPTEIDQLSMDDEPTGEAMLDEQDMDKGVGKIKHKDYFGADFNKSFLKNLEKVAKERDKEDGKGEYKIPKVKQQKVGTKSAIGS
jgi:hypothetical protein